MKYHYKLFTSLALGLFAFPALADILPDPDDPRHYKPIDYSKKFWDDRIDFALSIFLYFLATLLFELPIMYWFGFRSRRSISAVAIANLVSVPILQISLAYYGASWVMMEIAVIFIEFGIIKFMLKDVSWNKLLLALFAANLFSAVAGTLALDYFNLF